MLTRQKVIAAVILIAATILHGGDFASLSNEAATAVKAKDFASAEAKYAEAMNAAGDSVQKCRAIIGKYQALRSQKKWKEAESFMTEAVEDEMLKPQEIRNLLNTFASSYLWTNRLDFALELLQQAQNQPCPKTSNEYFRTYDYMSTIYMRKKQPQTALEVISKVLILKGLHPANYYTGHMDAGKACEKLNNKEEALKHYRLALENGKKVKYKFNYSDAEKAIERLSK